MIIDCAHYQDGRRQEEGAVSLEEAAARCGQGGFVWLGLFEPAPAELAEVPNMPPSLEAALDNLKRSHEFLLKGDVFTEDLVETWIDYKMSKEVSQTRLRPHPYEFALYYDA